MLIVFIKSIELLPPDIQIMLPLFEMTKLSTPIGVKLKLIGFTLIALLAARSQATDLLYDAEAAFASIAQKEEAETRKKANEEATSKVPMDKPALKIGNLTLAGIVRGPAAGIRLRLFL